MIFDPHGRRNNHTANGEAASGLFRGPFAFL
jgi:hypothetical protein